MSSRSSKTPPEQGPNAARRAHVAHAVEHAAHLLPSQGPIATFIHHNTLHAFQDQAFHDAIQHASGRLGVVGYLTEAEFRDAYRAGRIDDDDLRSALARIELPDSATVPDLVESFVSPFALRRAALLATPATMTEESFRWRLHEEGLTQKLPASVDAQTRATVLRDTSAWMKVELEAKDTVALRPLLDVLAESRGDRQPKADAKALADVEKLLAKDAEAVASQALWGVCIALHESCPEGAKAPLPAATTASEASDRLVHPTLVPLCAAYLDHGVAPRNMADRDKGFYLAWRSLWTDGVRAEPGWLTGLRERLEDAEAKGHDAVDAIVALLQESGMPDGEWDARIEAALLELPGWAGMFHRLEHFAHPGSPKATVADFLAVRLTLDAFAARAALPKRESKEEGPRPFRRMRAYRWFSVLATLGLGASRVLALTTPERAALVAALDGFDENLRRVVWQEAFEHHYYAKVLDGLWARSKRPLTLQQTPPLQIAFCIDDREESFRRHIEDLNPAIETFGVAGFFGLAIEYVGLDENDGTPLCPVGVDPPHLVIEEAVECDADAHGTRRQRRRLFGWMAETFRQTSHGALMGTALSATVGPISGVAMALRVLFPRAVAQGRDAVATSFVPTPRTTLRHRHRTADGQDATDEPNVDDIAARLADTFESMGFTKGFAPLVIFMAHGASSTNNPHKSAYDCGACGGRNGGPNARLFAHLANRADVRAKLAEKGIVIPATTHFVGGLHDTTSDAVTLFDFEAVPASHRGNLIDTRVLLDKARALNAQERCRRFESAPTNASPEAALRHVEARSLDMSQARPELGHATNSACVVGSRDLTRGLFLDRRSFLVSYSPEGDDDGRILERVLSAVVPVCGGVNLEYYFSRVDNARLGAGTKLPHNVTGYIGVMDGPTSDLRTGLPKQMIEIHEPVRLLMVIEAKPAVIAAIVERNAAIREFIANEWIRIAAVRPSDKGIEVLERDGFEAYAPSKGTTSTVPTFPSMYLGRDGFLDPVLSDTADPAKVASGAKGSASHAA